MYFENDTMVRNLLIGEPKRTQLIAFFEYNEQNFGINNDLTYVEFAEKFAYQPDKKVWSLRKNQSPGIRQQAIGRLLMLTPANGEVFYLR